MPNSLLLAASELSPGHIISIIGLGINLLGMVITAVYFIAKIQSSMKILGDKLERMAIAMEKVQEEHQIHHDRILILEERERAATAKIPKIPK